MTARQRMVALALAACVCVLVFATGCTAPPPSNSSGTSGGTTTGATPGGVTVVESNFQFSPNNLSIKIGDKVTFTNQDSTSHHVVVGTADLGVQSPGQTVTFVADKNGTVPFKCIIHPEMTGQIVVSAAGTDTGTGSSTPPTGGSGGGPAGGYGY